MKIIEFDDRGQQVERDSKSLRGHSGGSALAERPAGIERPKVPSSAGVELFMFQTGTLKTAKHNIKMNAGSEDWEIPVPWYLIKHPMGHVVIDGGTAREAAIDKRAYWGDVAKVYEPVLDIKQTCVEQCRSVGVEPNDVRYVLQSHLHLDHTGAVGRFPKAQHIVQRTEYDYAFDPQWFSAGAYIRADFDRPGLNWKFLGGETTDMFDLFGDDVIKMIFTPGHSPGHMSFLVNLPKTGPILLAIDAAYTMDHYENKALPGFMTSAQQTATSVAKLRRIAERTGARVVAGHDRAQWDGMRHAPKGSYA
ncbi:AttM family quorum-quenching N-acyl homoserine lactonase [Roseovarius sp. D0-M9]|uniref:AttM family quorum-quenching N-acyl homoserine lactonase n=1 Tax=Roseovarius sp. D0-M9 TaxID=3127117 RepID=UPI00300FDDF6